MTEEEREAMRNAGNELARLSAYVGKLAQEARKAEDELRSLARTLTGAEPWEASQEKAEG